MTEEIKHQREDTKSLYELGFHVLGSLDEASSKKVQEKILGAIEREGGVVKLSNNPELMTLAYTMTKGASGHKERYDTAYFGQFIFEADKESAPKISKSVNEMPEVLRTLLIEVPDDILVVKEKRSHSTKSEEAKPEEVKKVTEEAIAEAPINETEIDKTIEDLVIE